MELSQFDTAAMNAYLSNAYNNFESRLGWARFSKEASELSSAKNELLRFIGKMFIGGDRLDKCSERDELQKYLVLNLALDAYEAGISDADFEKAKEDLRKRIPDCWKATWRD